MSSDSIPVIGIVGGVGSGKTTVAEALSQILNSCRLDADRAGHQALEIPAIQEQLRETFGNEIFDGQGKVIRSALAQRVFGVSAEQIEARRRLEQIVHPFIRQRTEEELRKIRSGEHCDVILLDAALLLETGWSEICDAVVFIDVPREVRLKRVKKRGWTEEEFDRREASQLHTSEKQKMADLILANDRDPETTARALADWVRQRFNLNFTRDSVPVS